MLLHSLTTRIVFLFLLAAFAVAAAAKTTTTTTEESSSLSLNDEVCQTEDLWNAHPVLCHMLDRLSKDQKSLALEITEWSRTHGLLIEKFPTTTTTTTTISSSTHDDNGNNENTAQLPIVFAHGMGDSCYNSGMKHIVDHTSTLVNNIYTICIPIGSNQHEDTTNGYFLNMDSSVDIFAQSIITNSKLQNGFHAIGFSQGNNIIRGYIAKYNTPTVHTFLSINGVNGGVGAVPYCRPKEEEETTISSFMNNYGGGMCDLLMEQASKRAYTDYAQQHLFQANYWRDPRPVQKSNYKHYSQLAQWGNEGETFNQTLKDNFAKTSKFIWVMAEDDGMVWPKEGEHWGAPDPKDPFNHILPMNETEWYQKDLFGLKTAQEAGKNYFESFPGDHLQFEMKDFDRWVTTYLAAAKQVEALE